MKGFRKVIIVVFCILAGLPFFAHSATISGSGFIDTEFGTYTIDNVFFSANSTGTVDISVYAIGAGSNLLDTEINLYTDDSDLTIDDFVANNDDAAVPVTTLSSDSFLSLNLNSGEDYLLRISSYYFDSANIGDYNVDPGFWSFAGDYGFEITGDVSLTSFVSGPLLSEVTPVPLPPAVFLFLSGLVALFTRFKFSR